MHASAAHCTIPAGSKLAESCLKNKIIIQFYQDANILKVLLSGVQLCTKVPRSLFRSQETSSACQQIYVFVFTILFWTLVKVTRTLTDNNGILMDNNIYVTLQSSCFPVTMETLQD